MLHARVADYDPAWCDLLYERREIFEAYNKGLSFVPRRTEGFVEAMRDALRAYLRFGGATRLEWHPTSPWRDDCFLRAASRAVS